MTNATNRRSFFKKFAAIPAAASAVTTTAKQSFPIVTFNDGEYEWDMEQVSPTHYRDVPNTKRRMK